MIYSNVKYLYEKYKIQKIQVQTIIKHILIQYYRQCW